MAEGKIYIIVTNQLPGGGGEPTPGGDGEKKDKKQTTLQDFIQHRFFNFIESQAKQAINYSISNIGNFTGDYITQQHVSDAMQFVSFGLNLGTAALAGSKFGVPGAVVAVALTLAAKTITTTEQLLAGSVENARQNREIRQLRTRAGLSSSNNGSRGTEY